MANEAPLTGAEFEVRMAPFGPFEAGPGIAVAVSGGADSVALAVLADHWARSRGGRATALTVDHGLRSDSAGEAKEVGRRMARLGIDHRILRWTGAKPATGIQERARQARYALLTDWCRAAGVLHLLLGHHRRDQAETVLMRLSGGSGPDGLAAMAAIVETQAVRLLRPLLDVTPDRLRATLTRRRLTWIEDPSNRDPTFERVRMRSALPALADHGITEMTLAAFAATLGRARAALEDSAAGLIGRAAVLYPAGFARFDQTAFRAAPEEVSLRALARVLAAVGGRAYAPAGAKLQRLHARAIAGGGPAAGTLAGCRILEGERHFLVCRERRGLPDPAVVGAGEQVLWDGRFRIGLGGGGRARLAPLGAAGRPPTLATKGVPAPALVALPALSDDDGVFAVPALGFRRTGSVPVEVVAAGFRPRFAVSGARYFLASECSRIIS